MTTDAGEVATANADKAKQNFDRSVAELEKWKADPGPLQLETPEQRQAFAQDMRDTVAAINNVIASAEQARAAEQISISLNFKFRAKQRKLRESRQVWDEVIRRYAADRRIISMLIPKHADSGEQDQPPTGQLLLRAEEILSRGAKRDPADAPLTYSQISQDKPEASKGVRRPNTSECILCAYSPAAEITLRREVGMVIWRRRYRIAGRYCRNCGIALFRDVQNATMISGWWGVISAPVNLGSVIANAGEYVEFRRLSEPQPPREHLATVSRTPNAVGKPLLRRAGIWVSVAAITLAAFGIYDATKPSVPTSPVALYPPGLPYDVGSCVTTKGNNVTGVVNCTKPHFAEIVAIEGSSSFCPLDTTQTVKEQRHDVQPGKIVCLDDQE